MSSFEYICGSSSGMSTEVFGLGFLLEISTGCLLEIPFIISKKKNNLPEKFLKELLYPGCENFLMKFLTEFAVGSPEK